MNNKENYWRLSFHGRAIDIFKIRLINAFLMLITFGVYYPWAKIRMRRYLLSQVEFKGDRFIYHGTGKELFIGWVKAFFFFILPLIFLGVIVSFLTRGNEEIAGFVNFLISILIFLAIPVVIIGSIRYRLSRMSYRGVRFSFRGEIKDFAILFYKGTFFSAITFGLYTPLFQTDIHSFILSNSYFGNRRFSFNGDEWVLFKKFIIALLLTIPTFGIYWIWYLAQKQAYLWNNTSFSGKKIICSVTGSKLFFLLLGNYLIFLFTLGIGYPWIVIRNFNFICNNYALEPIDIENIVQEAQKDTSALAEGLDDFIDTGVEIGF